MSSENAGSTYWNLLATAWELLAFSLRRPDMLLAEAITSGEWASAAMEVSNASGVKLPIQFERHARAGEGADTKDLLHSLRIEYTRLFIGAPFPACTPYEGAWRASGSRNDVPLFVNSYAMEVENFFKRCGLRQAEGANDPLDHVALECELLEYLAWSSGGTACFSKPPQDSRLSPYETPQKAYEAFLEDHAKSWMPQFAKKASSQTEQAFYQAVSQLLLSVLEQA